MLVIDFKFAGTPSNAGATMGFFNVTVFVPTLFGAFISLILSAIA